MRQVPSAGLDPESRTKQKGMIIVLPFHRLRPEKNTVCFMTSSWPYSPFRKINIWISTIKEEVHLIYIRWRFFFVSIAATNSTITWASSAWKPEMDFDVAVVQNIQDAVT